jgi:hypothetical protein
MEAKIKQIDGKWTVNGKTYNELSIHEIGMLNSFFASWRTTTNQRCKCFCNNKVKELIANELKAEPTKLFDEAFNNPINQLNELTNGLHTK